MDPEANLKEQMRIVRELCRGEWSAERVDRLRELQDAMDEWVTNREWVLRAPPLVLR